MDRRGVYYTPAANSSTYPNVLLRNGYRPAISPTFASQIFDSSPKESVKPQSNSGVVRYIQPTTNYAALSSNQSKTSSTPDYSYVDRNRQQEINAMQQLRSNASSSSQPPASHVQVRGRDDYEYVVRNQAKKDLMDSWQLQIQSKKEAGQQLLVQKEQDKNRRLQELQDMVNKQKYRSSPMRSQDNFEKTVEQIEFDKNMNIFFGENSTQPQNDEVVFEMNKAAFYGYKHESMSPVKAPLDVAISKNFGMDVSSPQRLAKNTVKTVMHNPITGNTTQFQANNKTIPSLGKKSVENTISSKINYSPPPPIEMTPSYTAKNPKVHSYNPLTGNSGSPFYKPVFTKSNTPQGGPIRQIESNERSEIRSSLLNKTSPDNETVIYKIGQNPAPELNPGNIRIAKGKGYKSSNIF